MNKLFIFAILGLTISSVVATTDIKSQKWETPPGVVIPSTDKDYLSTDAILGGSVTNIYGDQPGNVSLYVVTPAKLALIGKFDFHTVEVNRANISHLNASTKNFGVPNGNPAEVANQSVTSQSGYWYYANILDTPAKATLAVYSRMLNMTNTTDINTTEIVSVDKTAGNTLRFKALWGQGSRFGVAYVINEALYVQVPNQSKDKQTPTLVADLAALFPTSDIRVFEKVSCSSGGVLSLIVDCSLVITNRDSTNKNYTGLFRTNFVGAVADSAKLENITQHLAQATNSTNITDLRQVWSNKARYSVATTVHHDKGFIEITAISQKDNATTVLNNENSAKRLSVYSIEPYFDGIVAFYNYPETRSTVYRTYHTEGQLVADKGETTVLQNNAIFKTFVNQRWELFALFDNQDNAGQLDSIYVGQIFKSVDGSYLKAILSFTASLMVAVLLF